MARQVGSKQPKASKCSKPVLSIAPSGGCRGPVPQASLGAREFVTAVPHFLGKLGCARGIGEASPQDVFFTAAERTSYISCAIHTPREFVRLWGMGDAPTITGDRLELRIRRITTIP
jgi:hypothetical protein